MDLLRYTCKFDNASVIGSIPSDCCLEAESVDIIVLIGVHMGRGLLDGFDEITAPWLKSMHRALRPKGIMVIHEGDNVFLEQGLIEKTEQTGFKLRQYFPPDSKSTEISPGGRSDSIFVFNK